MNMKNENYKETEYQPFMRQKVSNKLDKYLDFIPELKGEDFKETYEFTRRRFG